MADVLIKDFLLEICVYEKERERNKLLQLQL